MLNILIPITRPWAREAVCEAIAASDIPRDSRFILVLDAPGCDDWVHTLWSLGFDVEPHYTPNIPSTDRFQRRIDHNRMREFTLTLIPDEETPLLILDDDTIVPADVMRLAKAGPHATGVQKSRWGSPRCGVYQNDEPLMYRPKGGIEAVDYCGHYCLLTTGAMYRKTALHRPDECYTQPIPGLVVDWDCVCGHLTEEGVIWP